MKKFDILGTAAIGEGTSYLSLEDNSSLILFRKGNTLLLKKYKQVKHLMQEFVFGDCVHTYPRMQTCDNVIYDYLIFEVMFSILPR